MSTQIQRRRGTTAQHASFTGAIGETTIDTDKEVVVVHDGTQVGGYPLMRENASNSALALGSAATPSLKFTGDTNTGIYSPGADQVAISTGGSGRLFVSSAGRVGVGAVSTDFPFAVSNTASDSSIGIAAANTANSEIFFGDTDSLYSGRIRYGHSSDSMQLWTNSAERLRITSAGLVGVGTSSPNSFFHVKGGNNNVANIDNDGSQYTNLGFSNNGTEKGAIYWDNSNSAFILGPNAASSQLLFRANNAERARIDSSGRLGIGNSAPGALLHVTGTSGDNSIIRIQNTASGGQQFDLVAGAPGVTNPGFSIYDRTNSANRFYIDSSGRCGIGSTAPDGNLTIGGLTNTGGQSVDAINVNRTDGVRLFGVKWDVTSNEVRFSGNTKNYVFRNGSSEAETARIDSSGRLLVGTSSASTMISSTAANLQVQSTGTAIAIGIERATDDANPGYLVFRKTRSTSSNGVTVVQNGDAIGNLSFTATDGTAPLTAASISAAVDGTPGANDMPGRLVFSTTADGASSPTERVRVHSNGDISWRNAVDVYPFTDNAVRLGSGTYRYASVYAVNGTIQTSDERAKTQIDDATLGSTFIKSLRPVSYKWIEGGKRDTGERDEDNNFVYESVPGTRTHWGFIAQEVKEVVDAAGVDFGGWVLVDKDNLDSEQALRYDQFIAPLTKALQETMAELEALKAEVAALKAQ
jgi:hypothetical protein